MTTTTVADGRSRAELITLSSVSAVHLISHFYWLVFVPLLPALKDLLQVSFLELGFAITVMNVVSAATQAPTGFLVDRFGARLFLVLGVAVGAAGFVLIGVVATYPALLAGAVLIGLGNAVYHPADYSILSAEMSPERMGRAYSIHGFMGYLGFAVAPPIVLGLAWLGGTQFALVASGLLGVLVATSLLPGLARERRDARRRKGAVAKGSSARDLITKKVMALTLMFVLVNLSTGMMQTYMVVAFADLMGLSRSVGNTALTAFLFALVLGILLGGVLADRSERQSYVAAAGFGAAAVLLIALGYLHPDAPLALVLIASAGFLAGIIMPSRDLLVRKASPPDAVGRVFGIVTTGFNFGGMIGPLLGGALIDHAMPAWIFYGSAVFMALTVAVALLVERSGERAGAG
ncbi:MAG: transporter [Hyphomicrobiales bacterium]|nr:transporter [Hyphomicrobiales bacterium]